jgi:hypothetical protein
MKKKFEPFENMGPMERRKFLQGLGVLMSAPFVSPALRFACNEILMGEAYAQTVQAGQPSIFIEINFRDQWDFMCCFVPPSLATNPNLLRGFGSRVALFEDPGSLMQAPGNFYLTQAGRALAPHLDTIAVMELCELSQGDIHGHEAAIAPAHRAEAPVGDPAGRKCFCLKEHKAEVATCLISVLVRRPRFFTTIIKDRFPLIFEEELPIKE